MNKQNEVFVFITNAISDNGNYATIFHKEQQKMQYFILMEENNLFNKYYSLYPKDIQSKIAPLKNGYYIPEKIPDDLQLIFCISYIIDHSVREKDATYSFLKSKKIIRHGNPPNIESIIQDEQLRNDLFDKYMSEYHKNPKKMIGVMNQVIISDFKTEKICNTIYCYDEDPNFFAVEDNEKVRIGSILKHVNAIYLKIREKNRNSIFYFFIHGSIIGIPVQYNDYSFYVIDSHIRIKLFHHTGDYFEHKLLSKKIDLRTFRNHVHYLTTNFDKIFDKIENERPILGEEKEIILELVSKFLSKEKFFERFMKTLNNMNNGIFSNEDILIILKLKKAIENNGTMHL